MNKLKKRVARFLIFAVALNLLPVKGVSVKASTGLGLPITEDFEGYNIGDKPSVLNTTDWAKVTNDPAIASDGSGKYLNAISTAGIKRNISTTIAGSTLVVSQKIKNDTTTSSQYSSIVVGNATTSAVKIGTINNVLKAYNGSTLLSTGVNISDNSWHMVTSVLNLASSKYDLYIDGALIGSSYSFNTTGASITSVQFRNPVDDLYINTLTTLTAPTTISATATGQTTATISWDNNQYAYYDISRATSADGTYTKLNSAALASSTPAIQYNDTALTAGTIYFYKITAHRIDGTIDSSPVSMTTQAAVPGTPGNLQITGSTQNSIDLSWDTVAGATNYKLYRAADINGSYQPLNDFSSNTYTDDGLTASTTYFYKVSAVNSAGESPLSPSVSGTTQAVVAGAPSNLKVDSTGINSVNLSWDVTQVATGYNVYRSTDSAGTFDFIKQVTGNSYIDTELASSTTYYYKVSAIAGSETSLSNYVTATTKLAPPVSPSALVVSSSDINSINISWDSVAGATSYKVYRASDAAGIYQYINDSAANSYTDTGLASATSYYYRVSAVNLAGESQLSSFLIASTKLAPPVTPTGLKVNSSDVSSVSLVWDTVTGAENYKVYRASSSTGNFDYVDTSAINSYYDGQLAASTSYYYKVSAVNSAGESLQTGYIMAKTAEPVTSAAFDSYTLRPYDYYGTFRNVDFQALSTPLPSVFSITNGLSNISIQGTDNKYLDLGGTSRTSIQYNFKDSANKTVSIGGKILVDMKIKLSNLTDTYLTLPYIRNGNSNLICAYARNDKFGAIDGKYGKTPLAASDLWMDNLATYTPDVWHNLRFSIDTTARTFDIYLDGTKIASKYGFRADVSTINNIYIDKTNTDVSIDDINVYVDNKQFVAASDFESETVGSTPANWINGTVKQDISGKYLSSDNSSPATTICSYPAVLNGEIVLRSKLRANANNLPVALNITEGSKDIVKFDVSDGKLRAFNGNSVDTTNTKAFNDGLWHEFALVLNTRTNLYDVYFDGIQWVSQYTVINSDTGTGDEFTVGFGTDVDNLKAYIDATNIDTTDYVAKAELERLTPLVAALPEDTRVHVLKKASLTWAISNAKEAFDAARYTETRATLADIQNLLDKEIGQRTDISVVNGLQLYPNIPYADSNPFTINMFPLIPNGVPLTTALTGTGIPEADEVLQLGFAFNHPQSVYKENPEILKRMLSLLDAKAKFYNAGLGLSGTITPFEAAYQATIAYAQLSTSYPDLILPSKKVEWEKGIHRYMDDAITQYGNNWKNNQLQSLWFNCEVRIAMGVYFAGLLFNDARYIDYGHAGFLPGGVFLRPIQPDGGINYVGYQNEAYTYHQENIEYMGWYYLHTNDVNMRHAIEQTANYYPIMYDIGLGENYTAPYNKQYWNMSKGEHAMYIVASLTGDGQNYRLSQGTEQHLITPFFYRPDLTDAWKGPDRNYLFYDRNTMGPRGLFGNFTFAGTTRVVDNTAESNVLSTGKGTYVGATDLETTETIQQRYNNWQTTAAPEGTASISVDLQGSNYVKMYNPSFNNNAQLKAERPFQVSTGSVTVEASIKTDGGAGITNAPLIYSSDNKVAISAILDGNDLKVYDGNNLVPVYTLTNNVYAALKFQLDTATKKYDIYVNGTLMASQLSFKDASANDIAKLEFSFGKDAKAIGFDVIRVYNDPSSYIVNDTFINDTVGESPNSEEVGLMNRWPLNAALAVATSEVKYKSGVDTDLNRLGHYYLSFNDKNAATMGSDFASITTKYNITTKTISTLDSWGDSGWRGNQQWLMTKDRLVGMLELGTDTDRTAYAMDGLLRIVSGRNTWGIRKEFEKIDDTTYKYGDMYIKIRATDYVGGITTEYTDTFNGTAKKTGLLVLNDVPVDQQNTTRTYAAGTKHYYIAEIYTGNAEPSQSVVKLDLPDGLKGFEVTEAGRKFVLIHNLSDQAVDYNGTIATTWSKASVHTGVTNEVAMVPVADGKINVAMTIPANTNIIIACSDNDADHASGVKYYQDVFDVEAPSVPQNPVSVETQSSSAKIKWDGSTDNFGVSGYEIFRNDVLVASVTGTEFEDKGLQSETNYSYKIRARDINNIASAFSSTINVSTKADKHHLAKAVDEANNIYANARVGIQEGNYHDSDKAVFKATIDKATALLNKSDAAQQEVDNGVTELVKAQDTFVSLAISTEEAIKTSILEAIDKITQVEADPDKKIVDIPTNLIDVSIINKAAENGVSLLTKLDEVSIQLPAGLIDPAILNEAIQNSGNSGAVPVLKLCKTEVKDQLPEGNFKITGKVYDFTIQLVAGDSVTDLGKKFAENKEVTVSIKLTAEDLKDIKDYSKLRAYYYNPDTRTWEVISGGNFDQNTMTFTFKTKHFSTYTVGVDTIAVTDTPATQAVIPPVVDTNSSNPAKLVQTGSVVDNKVLFDSGLLILLIGIVLACVRKHDMRDGS